MATRTRKEATARNKNAKRPAKSSSKKNADQDPPAESASANVRSAPLEAGKTAGKAGGPTHPSDWSALSGGVREVLALFEERSVDLRFPGIDTDVFRDLVAKLTGAGERASEARRAYDKTQQEHRELELSLTEMAQRAYSYAQIFALRDPALQERLADFELASSSKSRRRKRSPAKAKSRGESGNLSLPLAQRETSPRTECAESGSTADSPQATQRPELPATRTEVELDEGALAALHVA